LQAPAKDLFTAYCFVTLFFIVFLEVLHVGKYEWSSGGPFSCTGTASKYNTFTATGDMEKKIRSVVLAIFTAFSIAVTIALWVIIADTDNNCFKIASKCEA
jgi:hypothetical protein